MTPLLRTRLHEAARALLDAHCDDDLDEARLEAEVLFAEAAGLDRDRKSTRLNSSH